MGQACCSRPQLPIDEFLALIRGHRVFSCSRVRPLPSSQLATPSWTEYGAVFTPGGSSPINLLSSSTRANPARVHPPFAHQPCPKFLLHRPPLDPDPSISPPPRLSPLLPWPSSSPGRRWSVRAGLGWFLLSPVRKSSFSSARMIHRRFCPRESFLRCRAIKSKSPFLCVADLPAAWLSTDASLISKNLGIQLNHHAPVPLFLNV